MEPIITGFVEVTVVFSFCRLQMQWWQTGLDLLLCLQFFANCLGHSPVHILWGRITLPTYSIIFFKRQNVLSFCMKNGYNWNNRNESQFMQTYEASASETCSHCCCCSVDGQLLMWLCKLTGRHLCSTVQSTRWTPSMDSIALQIKDGMSGGESIQTWPEGSDSIS